MLTNNMLANQKQNKKLMIKIIKLSSLKLTQMCQESNLKIVFCAPPPAAAPPPSSQIVPPPRNVCAIRLILH